VAPSLGLVGDPNLSVPHSKFYALCVTDRVGNLNDAMQYLQKGDGRRIYDRTQR